MIERPPTPAPELDLSTEELLARRFEVGRRARGLAADAPFTWDRGPGLDELEELVDAAIYRRERYRLWYGRDRAGWPEHAHEGVAQALAEVEALRLELRHGPLAVDGERAGGGGVRPGRDRRSWGNVERRSRARRGEDEAKPLHVRGTARREIARGRDRVDDSRGTCGVGHRGCERHVDRDSYREADRGECEERAGGEPRGARGAWVVDRDLTLVIPPPATEITPEIAHPLAPRVGR